MKLIIKEYLASLRERDELDVVLPDLLSQMGLTVFSRPGRGTRQDGVDVAAVGSIDGAREAVYLFSIKPGDLRRNDWNGSAVQSLRPSLDEIIDAYIPNRLPTEHDDKPVKICICVGGDIREEVRNSLEGFKKRNSDERIDFEEWNGDKMASLIEENFLSEDLMPDTCRSSLRKAIALIDEPEASYRHFSALVRSLLDGDLSSPAKKIQAVRQLGICLWILLAWAREQGNLESAYLSSEYLLLRAWEITREFSETKTNAARAIVAAYSAVLATYFSVGSSYVSKVVIPYAAIPHGLSSAVGGSKALDVNLRLFDVAGRTALCGIWSFWQAGNCREDAQLYEGLMTQSQNCARSLKQLVNHNPALLQPMKDDHCIDIALGVLLLLYLDEKTNISGWLSQIADRVTFAYDLHQQYPCTLSEYHELLEHAQKDDGYRTRVTAGSTLHPMIAIVSAMIGDIDLFEAIKDLKMRRLDHCNFQYWYPDSNSENHLYVNDRGHGATLSDVRVEGEPEELLQQVFGECDNMPQLNDLTAVKARFWPLVLIACRHYRLPIPLHFFQQQWAASGGAKANATRSDSSPLN
ncbi:MAG: hypothetical protein AAGI72_14125 [Pseudomonadota bacterium]